MSIVVENAVKKFGDFAALGRRLDRGPRRLADGAARPLRHRASRRCCARSPGSRSSTTGKVLINGTDMTHTAVQDRGVGFCFQHYAAFKHMTVRQNVAFGLSIQKRPKDEIEERVQRAAAPGPPRGVHRPLPVAALRRPAPADGARPGARGRAEGAAARRAVRRARREGAQGAAPVAAPPPRRGPRDDDLRHPRPGGGDGRRRADRRRERRAGRADGPAAGDLRAPGDGVRDELHRPGQPARLGLRPPARRRRSCRRRPRAPRRR